MKSTKEVKEELDRELVRITQISAEIEEKGGDTVRYKDEYCEITLSKMLTMCIAKKHALLWVLGNRS